MARSHGARGCLTPLLLAVGVAVAPSGAVRAAGPSDLALVSSHGVKAEPLPKIDLKRLRTKLGSGNQAEHDFVCPISRDVMRDPVVTSAGKTYDRNSIETWLKDHSTDPLTMAPVTKDLTPNLDVRAKLAKLLQTYPEISAPPEADPELVRRFAQPRCHSWCVKCTSGRMFWITRDRAEGEAIGHRSCPDVWVHAPNVAPYNLTADLFMESARLRHWHAQLNEFQPFYFDVSGVEQYNKELTYLRKHYVQCLWVGAWFNTDPRGWLRCLTEAHRSVNKCFSAPKLCGDEGVLSFRVAKAKDVHEEEAAKLNCFS